MQAAKEEQAVIEKEQQEEQYVTFALRNRQTNEQTFNMIPVQTNEKVLVEETKKVEKQPSL